MNVIFENIFGRRESNNRASAVLATTLAIIMALSLDTSAYAADTYSDNDWMRVTVARKNSEVSIWSRYVSGQQMKQFRGETFIASNPEKTLALLLDTDSMPGWLWRCESARILRKIGPREYVVYMRFSAFWPLADRDAVLHVVPTYDEQSKSLMLTAKAIPDYLPEMQGIVRVPAISATFLLEPVSENMRVEMTGHFDPGGIVPLWAANFFITFFPKHSLTRMREILESDSYASGLHLKAGREALSEIRNAH